MKKTSSNKINELAKKTVVFGKYNRSTGSLYTMRKILLFLTLVTVCGSLALTGCNSRNSDNTVNDTKFPEEINYESDNLKVSCKLDIPDDFDISNLKKATAKTVILSDHADTIYSTFSPKLEGTEYTENKVYDDEGIKGIQKLWNKTNEVTHATRMLNLFVSSMYYMTEDCSKSTLGRESLRESEEVGSYASYPEGYKENSDLFRGELSFDTEKNIEAKLTKQFNEWGFGRNFSYDCFGVSKDLVKQQYCYMKADGSYNTDISPKDLDEFKEYYQLYGRQELYGLPVFYYSGVGGIYREECPIKAAIGADGIEYLEILRIFSFKETDESIDGLASYDEILNTIKSRYEDIVTRNTFEINRGGLYYYAKGNGNKKDFDMIPAWCFIVREHNKGDGQDYEKILLIDAVTGKEMPYEP